MFSGSKEKERRARRFARNPSFLQGKPPKDPRGFFKKKFKFFGNPHTVHNTVAAAVTFLKIYAHNNAHIKAYSRGKVRWLVGIWRGSNFNVLKIFLKGSSESESITLQFPNL